MLKISLKCGYGDKGMEGKEIPKKIADVLGGCEGWLN